MKDFNLEYRGDEPDDPDAKRVYTLCKAAMDAIQGSPEYEGERVMFLLDNSERRRGGFLSVGYEDDEGYIDDRALIDDLLAQARLIARMHGFDFSITVLSMS